MKVPFKAQATARDLAVRLKNSVANLVVTEDLDADRFPTLKCSVGTRSVFVRISTDYERSEETGLVDGIGLPQSVYAPHKVEICQEDAATAHATTLLLRTVVLAQCAQLGMKLSIREGADVQDVATWALADADATTVIASIQSDDIHPLTKQM